MEGRSTSCDGQFEGRLLNRSLDLHEGLIDGLPLAVFGLAEDGRLLLCNRRMRELLQRDAEALLGKPFLETVMPAMDTPEVRQALVAAQGPDHREAVLELELELQAGAAPASLLLHFRPLPFRDRELVAIILEDVTAEVRLRQERERLLAALFHDLRAPLSGICTFGDVVVDEAAAGLAVTDLRDALQQVSITCRDMIELIDSTTEQLRGDAGQEEELLDLAFLLHGLALETQLGCHHGELLVSCNAQPVSIGGVDGLVPQRVLARRADAARSLRNLLHNAAKYAAGRIDLRVFEDAGQVEVWIDDDGPGIPAGYEQEIFAGGVQAPGARPGTGLGLETVRLWAEAMGGSVCAERGSLGGARFRLRVPLA